MAASSAWMDAAESALNGSPAFALTRPPGHHATAGVGMGKWLFLVDLTLIVLTLL